MKQIKKTLAFDLLVMAGIGPLLYGLSLVYAPLVWIVPGAALVGFGIWGAWRCS